MFILQKSVASAALSTLDRFVALEGRYIFGGLSSASISQCMIFGVQKAAFFLPLNTQPQKTLTSPPVRSAFYFSNNNNMINQQGLKILHVSRM